MNELIARAEREERDAILVKNPLIVEINTWVWLDELSRREQRALTLASIPDAEWDHIAALGFDAVWFMGVWERSP